MVESPTIWSELQPGKTLLGVSLLWRGFRHRFRRESSRNLQAPRGLRPKREIDNFSCSHHCTLPVRCLVRAAFGVSALDASRYSLAFSCVLPLEIVPLALPLTKMFLHILLDLLYVRLCPAPVFAAVHSDLLGGAHLPSTNPILQRHPMNPKFCGCFLCRICLPHLNYTIVVYVVKHKSHSRCTQQKLRIRRAKEYLSSLGGFEPEFYSSCRVVPDRPSDLKDRAVLGGL